MKIILENSTIHSLFLNNAITTAFPFIKNAAERYREGIKKSDCGGCNKRGFDYNSIKAIIAHMTPENKGKFKTILGANQVQVNFAVGGKPMEILF